MLYVDFKVCSLVSMLAAAFKRIQKLLSTVSVKAWPCRCGIMMSAAGPHY